MSGDARLLEFLAHLIEMGNPVGVFLIFCRVGGCLMLAPGLGSGLIPSRVRLLLAGAVTFVVAPIVLSNGPNISPDGHVLQLARVCLFELAIGLSMGVIGRLFLSMMEFLATVASTGIGMANPFGVTLEPGEILPPLATFVGIASNAIVFATGLHWQVLAAIVDSYSTIPVGAVVPVDLVLGRAMEGLASASQLALRVFSPLVAYAILVNFSISLINRLTPQVAIFYISTPFIVAGALWILLGAMKGALSGFAMALGAWIARL